MKPSADDSEGSLTVTHHADGEGAVTEKRANWTLRILFAVLALAVVAVIVFSLLQMNSDDDSAGETSDSTSEQSESPSAPDPTDTATESDDVEPSKTPSGTNVILEKPLGGQDAIDALGDDIQIVADRNNMTVDEVKDLLLKDPNMMVSPTGHIFASGG